MFTTLNGPDSPTTAILMADELSEAKFFATFEKHGEFANAQQSFLVLDLNQVPSPEEEKREAVLFQKLSNIVCFPISRAMLRTDATDAVG